MAKALEEYVKSHGGDKVIKKILIANNGMAATKAIMSMRQWAFLELGTHKALEFVAMASSDDLQANAEFIRLSDAYVEVPPGKNSNNYANVPLICEIAKSQGVDAVWPGWGHASENPALPRSLAEMGITFLGPTAPVMHALGDKIASTILAQSSKVPCIPWNGEGVMAEIQADGSIPQEPFERACLKSYEESLACAKRIGYPVVLKASEGGGGKGIRKCTNDEELKLGWEQVTTEVVGSPIFMMQLCTGARHLEVQLVGDHHGDVIALIGRDCSTQRRFQKIFEEGPPTIADKDDFREAEKAAQRLAKSVGYRGAGTVEYLYKPETKGFYFLELNPRLQVEHPVTEGITGVNLPALQLQVGMGIPLSRVPDIRRFYGLEAVGDSKIDFLEDKYTYPNTHVIAARVTAENPDDAFRPTSGKIERVRFQSSPSAWGYFSIGANGGIHEFADSQFGHIFAKGPDRESARKALQVALKNMSVTGEIRNPIEYLVELADTPEFKENTIDTAWLDRLIAEKSVKANIELLDMVFYAACFRAYAHVKENKKAALEGLERGHLPLHNELRLLQSFQVELAQGSTKYVFTVARVEEDAFALTIGSTTLEARIREQPDGSIYIKSGEHVSQVTGVEEPLGLRLRVEGHGTMVFPRIRDPSELRSDFNGKLVRYLHADGADVAEGEAFVELEAMKMIMSLRSSTAGKIHHSLGAGAIVGAGQLLATLDLADPSKVQMIKPFAGKFELSRSKPEDVYNNEPASPATTDPAMIKLKALGLESVVKLIKGCLNGFPPNPQLSAAGVTSVITRFFSEESSIDKELQFKVGAQLLTVFLDNERFFAGLVGGDETQIKAKFTGSCQELLQLILAHDTLKDSLEIVGTLLHCLSNLSDREDQGTMPGDLTKCLQEIAALPQAGGYSHVKLAATEVLDLGRRKPVNQRRDEIRAALVTTPRKDLGKLAHQFNTEHAYFGLDLVSSFFKDGDAEIRSKGAEVYFRRMYRGSDLSAFETLESKEVIEGTPAATQHFGWSFCRPGAPTCPHSGYAVVLPSAAAYDSLKSKWVLPATPKITEVHIIVADEKVVENHEQNVQKLISSTADLIAAAAPALNAKQVETVHVLVVFDGARPTYLHYDKACDWKERVHFRDLRSSLPFLIETTPLMESYNLSCLIFGRLWACMFGQGLNRPDAILARGVSHAPLHIDDFATTIEEDMSMGFDNIEKAMLNPKLQGKLPVSMFWLHYVAPITASTQRDLKFFLVLFDKTMQQCIVRNNARLLKLRLEKVTIKIWIGNNPIQSLRLVARASDNWQVTAYTEELNPQTALPVAWTDIETQERKTSIIATQKEDKDTSKRMIARKADSTYIYDFPSLFRIGLMKNWLKVTTEENIPEKVLDVKELVLQGDELVESDREPGLNNVGMVAWLVTMRTPEYPGGREVVIIGNDLTIKAGSFGTVEDDVFAKASKLAREKGIPRLYIACNSGARLGAVEELKSMVQVAWIDPQDLMKGFEYLYISEADLAKLPVDSVRSHPVTVNGQVRCVLDTIMGLNLPSTKGGIGVENLQGSGLIAGETSRAYEETFTLSYITGRSVGIGAYLNRLGQRNIQMVHGPMILTGFQALNKLLGQQVYTTQDQLGGPHIMVPNGVTHELVQDDQGGVDSMLKWLSFVPQNVLSIPPITTSVDPIERQVDFMPTKAPYDPRHMLAGVQNGSEFVSGFCDKGSFHEYMEGWGKTVIIGRARLGGMPVGIVSVETRAVERHIPADPADSTSSDTREAQAGQVWYPDSAFKTAQAIRDFNRGENLPLIIFANWRGFSGGTRDMFAEVLKYGAMIVDALVDYKQPVTIYIPPNGELRGGAWVVLDPKINPQQMEMFADVEGRGGILEPPAAAEIVFKGDKHVLEMMHRCDEQLQGLDAKAKAGENVAAAIKEREKLLLPMYRQVSVMYCDLHDKSGRMKGLGAIREELEWKNSRAYLHWRIRRRLQENNVVRRLLAEVPGLDHDGAVEIVKGICEEAKVCEDKAVALWLEENTQEVDAGVEKARQSATADEIYRLVSSLPVEKRAEVVRDLVGFAKVASTPKGKR